MKKSIALLLALSVLFTSLLAFNFSAYAAGWADYTKDYKLNKTYTETVTLNDYTERDSIYKSCKFDVPAKGTIDIVFESENENLASVICYLFDNNDKEISLGLSRKYVPSIRAYRSERERVFEKGTYYLNTTYWEPYVNDGTLDGEYRLKLIYTPDFSDTSIKKLEGRKKAFTLKWKKAGRASGYQIKYSLKKNLKSAKTVNISKAGTVSKTVKKLKKRKTYYVRIRSYKKVKINGKYKTYYGKWTKTKSVKTK